MHMDEHLKSTTILDKNNREIIHHVTAGMEYRLLESVSCKNCHSSIERFYFRNFRPPILPYGLVNCPCCGEVVELPEEYYRLEKGYENTYAFKIDDIAAIAVNDDVLCITELKDGIFYGPSALKREDYDDVEEILSKLSDDFILITEKNGTRYFINKTMYYLEKASLYLRKDKWLCVFSATDSREIFEFKNIDNISEFLTNDKIFVHISEDCDIKTFYMWIKWLKKFREHYPEEYLIHITNGDEIISEIEDLGLQF